MTFSEKMVQQSTQKAIVARIVSFQRENESNHAFSKRIRVAIKSLTDWTRGAMPKDSMLMVVAEALDVSFLYLKYGMRPVEGAQAEKFWSRLAPKIWPESKDGAAGNGEGGKS